VFLCQLRVSFGDPELKTFTDGSSEAFGMFENTYSLSIISAFAPLLLLPSHSCTIISIRDFSQDSYRSDLIFQQQRLKFHMSKPSF